MIRRPPRSTLDRSSAASDVYKRQSQLVEDDVDDRRRQQRHHLARDQPADDGDAERPAQLGAVAEADRQRQRAERGGERRHQDRPEAQQAMLIAAAIVVIYIVLGMLYESLVHPVTVLSTLPSAGVGAVLALLMFRMDFSIIALIGVFLLIGIVKKNAILIIDFAPVSYTHLRAHETGRNLVCRLL